MVSNSSLLKRQTDAISYGLGFIVSTGAKAVSVANTVCDLMSDDSFHQRTTTLGEKRRSILNELKIDVLKIADVRRQGLMVASILKYAKDNGVILLSCGIYGNRIRFLTSFNHSR